MPRRKSRQIHVASSLAPKNLTPVPINDCWGRALRAPMAARYIGSTPGALDAAAKAGQLKFRVMPDGGRVFERHRLDEWLESFPEQSGMLERRGHALEKSAEKVESEDGEALLRRLGL